MILTFKNLTIFSRFLINAIYFTCKFLILKTKRFNVQKES